MYEGRDPALISDFRAPRLIVPTFEKAIWLIWIAMLSDQWKFEGGVATCHGSPH